MKKKKFVPAIVAGSISLLLAGLIYLGISAFPELLQEEEAVEIEETKHTLIVGDMFVARDSELSDGQAGNAKAANSFDAEDVIAINANSKSNGAKISTETKEITTEVSIRKGHQSFREENFLNGLDKEVLVVSLPSKNNNTVISNNHASSHSFEKSEEHITKQTTKAQKAINNQTSHSNPAVVETSLLVVGAVDVLSMILIKRRKHILR